MPNRAATDSDLLPTLMNKAESIAARVGPTTESGCWMWVGAFTYNGYGTFSIGAPPYRTRTVRAHRAVFMLHHGRPIIDGMTLHHVCRVTACVNPAHLVELTQEDNTAADATGGASIRYRPGPAGPRWAVLFREAGKQRSRTFASREAAEAYASERLARRVA